MPAKGFANGKLMGPDDPPSTALLRNLSQPLAGTSEMLGQRRGPLGSVSLEYSKKWNLFPPHRLREVVRCSWNLL